LEIASMRIVTSLIMIAVLAGSALAHDSWINHGRYTSPKTGELCCGDQDCQLVPTEDVKITAQGYALTSGEVIPYAEALRSEDGHFWRCHRFDAARSRRCFFAPEPAS
jgi:hypothetical protein